MPCRDNFIITLVFVRKLKIRGRTYLAEVEGYRDEKGRVRQRFVRYLGKLDGGRLIEPRYKRLGIARVYPCGIQEVVRSLAEEHGLSQHVSSGLLCLATMHLLQPSSLNSVAKNFHRFGLDTYFGHLSPSKLYSSLDLSEEEIYRAELELYRSVRRSSSSIFYDITSIYFYGSSCSLAARGYNPRAALPQVNIGLAVDGDGVPIFHRVFRGNVHGGATLRLFLECLKNAGLRRCMLVLDRGFFSDENVSLVRESGYHITVGVPLRGRVKAMMEGEKAEMRETVLLRSTYLYVKEMRWKGGRLILCFNEKEAATMKNLLLRRGKKANTLLGCYALYTSDLSASREEIVRRYFERDLIERSFKALKSVLGLGPLRHWLENKVNNHIYVCYLSYLLLTLLQRKLKDKGLTIFKALDELKYVYKVSTKEGVERTVATTKTQKKILKLMGIKM